MKKFKEFLNKKNIFIFGFVLILIVGGLFFWLRGEKEIKGSSDDYQIIETAEGVFVENKRAGLTAKVPDEWSSKKIEIEEGWIMLNSPETEIEWKEDNIVLLPLKKGCIIETVIIYEDMDFIDIKLDTRYGLATLDLKSVEFEEIIIDNHPALKAVFDTEKVGPGISINIPQNRKVYNFSLTWGIDEKEDECIQEFEEFLEAVSIK